MRNRALTTCFYNLLSSADGIHIHGLWEHSSLLAARYARAKRIPYVVSAHGMLERWALANKRLKKTVYSALIERENLLGAGCLIALTKKEAEDYRRYGARRPIAVIPNGVEIPEQISAERFHAVYPELAGKRIVLFLGRIHYKKGLDLLIRAWKGISRKYRDTHLVIAGPDSEGMQAQAEQQIAEEQIGDRVLFTGVLRGEMKWSALAAAECFVLPSRSEGFSVSVLEAMGASLPVIVTNACNVPEIATEEAGIVVPVDARRLESALRLILNNASAANRHIGARGRRLVREKYDWASIGAQMSEVYAWVQGGPAPRSVEIMPA